MARGPLRSGRYPERFGEPARWLTSKSPRPPSTRAGSLPEGPARVGVYSVPVSRTCKHNRAPSATAGNVFPDGVQVASQPLPSSPPSPPAPRVSRRAETGLAVRLGSCEPQGVGEGCCSPGHRPHSRVLLFACWSLCNCAPGRLVNLVFLVTRCSAGPRCHVAGGREAGSASRGDAQQLRRDLTRGRAPACGAGTPCTC